MLWEKLCKFIRTWEPDFIKVAWMEIELEKLKPDHSEKLKSQEYLRWFTKREKRAKRLRKRNVILTIFAYILILIILVLSALFLTWSLKGSL